MSTKYKATIVIAILLIVLAWEKIGYILERNQAISTLKKSKTEVIIGKMENIHQIYKTKRWALQFSYEYNGKRYTDEKVLENEIERDFIFKSSYPVLISKAKPEVNYLLFYPSDFKGIWV